MNLDTVVLPKWPAMVVVGKPVTPELAGEIILRTTDSFHNNSKELTRQVLEALGMTSDPYGYPTANSLGSFFTKVKSLCATEPFVEYLRNERIVSTWIGGPHGWIDWSGFVGCNNYNIGKWPTAAGVWNDWFHIARAFPELELTCQLFDKETTEPDPKPLVEYRVKGGKVRAYKPKKVLLYPKGLSDADFFAFALPAELRECGVSMEHLAKVFAAVRAKFVPGGAIGPPT